jgi:ParB-like chromosome segregation protein Spo0J/NADH:ubiquinone oxidoreductase subunit E
MESERVVVLPIEKIVVPEGRFRRNLGDLNDLARSIKLAGNLQPIVVRSLDDGRYELVLGERRLKAMQQLGYKETPAIVRPYDKRMAKLAEIEENVRRLDYDSVERAKALALYYEIVKEILGEPKPGRPEALTPEQVERAKQLREQGKSLSEIAGEFGVSRETVRQYLEKRETAIQAPPAESGEKIRNKLEQNVPISGQKTSGFTLEEPSTRAVAEELGVSHAMVVRATKVADAVKKYPVLEEIGKSAVIAEVHEMIKQYGLMPEEVERAVELIRQGYYHRFAVHCAKVKDEAQRQRLLEIYREGKYPPKWMARAAGLVWSYQGRFTADSAVKAIVDVKEYKVKIPHGAVIEAVEKAAEEQGLTAEAFIALAAVEKVRDRVDELFYRDSVQTIRGEHKAYFVEVG